MWDEGSRTERQSVWGELKNDTTGVRAPRRGSRCAPIDFSLVNLDLDFISPSKVRQLTKAGQVLWFPPEGKFPISCSLVIRNGKMML